MSDAIITNIKFKLGDTLGGAPEPPSDWTKGVLVVIILVLIIYAIFK